MQRRSFIKNTTLTLASLSFLSKATLASLLNEQPYKIKMLNNNIGVFSEKGGTILFMLSKKGTVVVDAQFPDSAQHCIDEIKKKTSKPFQLLINTHHHYDHTSGNIAFKNLVQNIVAHTNSLKNQTNAAQKNNTENKQLYPNITFDKSWSKKLTGEKISLHYFGAAHTNGDIVVHFEKAKIVHLGDLVFNRKYPYIDKSAGANITNWSKILEEIATKFEDATQFICGHAGDGYEIVISKTDILQFKNYLDNLLTFTKESINKALSKEDYLKTTTIIGSPDWKGEGISRSLEAAWAELKENN
ncbi:MAG: MBL fold metallo-hydrolase [Ferruginibacter sp.]|nr:MBL fold metallo-hydrolase [Ferruginibacter sp.]